MKYEVGYIILHNTEEFLTSKWSGGGMVDASGFGCLLLLKGTFSSHY